LLSFVLLDARCSLLDVPSTFGLLPLRIVKPFAAHDDETLIDRLVCLILLLIEEMWVSLSSQNALEFRFLLSAQHWLSRENSSRAEGLACPTQRHSCFEDYLAGTRATHGRWGRTTEHGGVYHRYASIRCKESWLEPTFFPSSGTIVLAGSITTPRSA